MAHDPLSVSSLCRGLLRFRPYGLLGTQSSALNLRWKSSSRGSPKVGHSRRIAHDQFGLEKSEIRVPARGFRHCCPPYRLKQLIQTLAGDLSRILSDGAAGPAGI